MLFCLCLELVLGLELFVFRARAVVVRVIIFLRCELLFVPDMFLGLGLLF